MKIKRIQEITLAEKQMKVFVKIENRKRFSSLEPFLSIKFAISYCASSSKASIKKLTGRKPSLQEIMADFGFFIHPL